jgi:type III secretion protein S
MLNEADILNQMGQALLLTLVLSMPPILVASVVGVLVALIQAVTQVQEQTLSFAVKLVACIAVIFLTARWLGIEIVRYTMHIFDMIPNI